MVCFVHSLRFRHIKVDGHCVLWDLLAMLSASQESSVTSSLSGSWWLWPYFRVMPPITATEVKPAVKKMKCGPDSIPAGVWKLPGCHNASILASQFNWIISHDEVLRFGWPALQCPFGRAKVMSWSAQVISWFGEISWPRCLLSSMFGSTQDQHFCHCFSSSAWTIQWSISCCGL